MKEFDYSLVKNPEYFKDGRMEAHSDHITYANVEEVSAGETSYRHSLNGIWKFHYARNYGNTNGKGTRIFTQGRFRSISILWQAM